MYELIFFCADVYIYTNLSMVISANLQELESIVELDISV